MTIDTLEKTIKAAVAKELKKAISAQPAMVSLDKKEGTAMIDIKHADGTTSTSQESVMPPKLFSAPACNVGVSSKLTIPIAPYTNAQVSVSLNIPCTHGEIDQVYDFAKDWIDTRMTALKKQIDQAKGVSG